MTPGRAALRETAERFGHMELEESDRNYVVSGLTLYDMIALCRDYLDLTAPLLVKCRECGGAKQVRSTSAYAMVARGYMDCPACHGTGSVEREDIAAIRKRAEAATPGPWTLDKNFQCFIWGPNMQMIADNGQDEDGTLTRMRGVGANLPLKDNGEFIAHSRTDIPLLLDLIAAQAQEIAELKGKANG